ncbi:MAG: TatD family hydrolase [Flavobacteriaceae bacterium]|nr:TatD family hydrolase [Flavobacteriaceae bacterium]|tara:strand:+ start:329 stop:1114 length:786 start_codon:yes stop_codon:yes gene_type:complete
MHLIDTHTHLYTEVFDADCDAVIERAQAAGVKQFYLPAIDLSYYAQMLALEKRYPQQIQLMMGLHPTHVKEDYSTVLAEIESLFEQRTFAAVGEIGIDLYWDKTFLSQQQKAFSYQINWAKKYRLPIVIHCRDAFEEVFEVLETHKGDELYGIFHCFTGTEVYAQRAIDLNLKLGIGGVVTFKNGKINKFLHEFDLEHIVLETDSPYLAPTPFRGKRNESAYLIHVAQAVAECYGISVEQVAAQTTKNAEEVFHDFMLSKS